MKSPLHVTNWLTPASTEVSHFLAADNQLVIANGINAAYKLGELRKDLGYSAVGNAITASQPIRGLFDFRQSSATQKVIATLNDATNANTELYYSTGGNFTNIVTAAWNGTPNMVTSAETFISYMFFVGHDGTSTFLPVASLTGTTFSTATNVGSMPQAKYIKRYRDRLYVANAKSGGTEYPYRIYFSSVPAAGAITWTPASDFIDVDFAEQITGLGVAFNRLIAFTEFSSYVYDQITWQEVKWPGCANHFSIQSSDAYLIYANKDNVWASTGGRPQAIGNDIVELIRNSTPSSWVSCIVDREYQLYLGSTSANGISYTNCVASFDLQTGMWRWRELGHAMKTMAMVSRSGEDYQYMGCNTNGKVYKKGRYKDATLVSSDDGLSILGWFRTKAYDMGDPSVRKQITQTIAYCENAQGVELRFRALDRNQEALMPFAPVGTLKSVVNVFDKRMEGYFIQFEGKEYSTKQFFKFYGLTFTFGPDTKRE